MIGIRPQESKIYLSRFQNWITKKMGLNSENKSGSLPFLEKVKTNRELFGHAVRDSSSRLGIPPEYLMIVMNNETAGTMSHTIKNPYSSAVGLIQFMRDTAKSLGTSVEALVKMTNVEQLHYVEKYLHPYSTKFTSVADVYLAVFFPLALYKDDSYVFPAWAVKANPIFDLNKDGSLTKKEFKNYVLTKYAKYL